MIAEAPDDVANFLAPFLNDIWDCVAAAIKEYHALTPAQKAIYRPRTRASIIHDNIVHNVTKRLAEVPGILFMNRKGRFSILIEDKFEMRFKKFDRHMRTSNIPTRQTWDFIHQVQSLQSVMLDLPDPLVNLNAGYQWNALQTDIQGVFIVCPNGHRNDWVLEITGPDAPTMVQAPEDGIGPTDQPRTILPKDTPIEKARGEGLNG